MNENKFTPRAEESLRLAQEAAQDLAQAGKELGQGALRTGAAVGQGAARAAVATGQELLPGGLGLAGRAASVTARNVRQSWAEDRDCALIVNEITPKQDNS